MSTFFGGLQLTSLEIKEQTFTPSDFQNFTVYTVPTGFFAKITLAHIGNISGIGAIEYSIYHVTNRKQFPSTPTVEKEIISLDGGAPQIIENGEIQMFQGESLVFRSGTSTNLQTQYYIVIEVYKMP
jgi:hypothetical protein